MKSSNLLRFGIIAIILVLVIFFFREWQFSSQKINSSNLPCSEFFVFRLNLQNNISNSSYAVQMVKKVNSETPNVFGKELNSQIDQLTIDQFAYRKIIATSTGKEENIFAWVSKDVAIDRVGRIFIRGYCV